MIIDSSTKLYEFEIKISFKLLIPDTINKNGSKFISDSFYYHIILIITFIFFFLDIPYISLKCSIIIFIKFVSFFTYYFNYLSNLLLLIRIIMRFFNVVSNYRQ